MDTDLKDELHSLEVNPNYSLSFLKIPAGEGDVDQSDNVCIIVDDFLLHPEKALEYAILNRSEFVDPKPFAYPGTIFRKQISDSFKSSFEEILRKVYYLNETTITDFNFRYSIISTKPEELKPIQTICHIDINRDIDPDIKNKVSGVLFLFKNPLLGGTAFYKKLDNLSTRELEKANPPVYMTKSNRNFEFRNSIDAKWNRLIMYPSNVWHSAHIEHPELLSSDPQTGRLTVNIVGSYTD